MPFDTPPAEPPSGPDPLYSDRLAALLSDQFTHNSRDDYRCINQHCHRVANAIAGTELDEAGYIRVHALIVRARHALEDIEAYLTVPVS